MLVVDEAEGADQEEVVADGPETVIVEKAEAPAEAPAEAAAKETDAPAEA